MKVKIKDIAVVVIMAVLLFGLSMWAVFRKPDEFSESERRVMAQRPKVTAESVLDGSFMTDFESYTVDQFPMRDTFRGVKSFSELYVFNKIDNNGLYTKNGYISKKEYPKSDAMMDNAIDKINKICEMYLDGTNTNVYFSIIPDKNCFMADQCGQLSLDYPAFIKEMQLRPTNIQYICIDDLLELDDFYKTDTHWRQEKIIDVADRIALAMGTDVNCAYEQHTLDSPFYGVYYGQLALPVKADKITYLTSEKLDRCKVTSYNTSKPVETSVYDMDKAQGRDPYEMFLGGADPLIVIEDPEATEKRELVIFRDSFGSSLTPLLMEGYSKITLVDIRYVQTEAIRAFVQFDDQDVLFIYSTLILNNSLAFK